MQNNKLKMQNNLYTSPNNNVTKWRYTDTLKNQKETYYAIELIWLSEHDYVIHDFTFFANIRKVSSVTTITRMWKSRLLLRNDNLLI